MDLPLLISIDGSLNDRFAHMTIPYFSLFHSYGLGLGLGTWATHADSLAERFADTFPAFRLFWFSAGGRIMSGWGTVVFELGVFGLLLVGVYFLIVAKSFKTPRRIRVSTVTAALMLFFMPLLSLSLAFPFVGYLTGVLLRTTSKSYQWQV